MKRGGPLRLAALTLMALGAVAAIRAAETDVAHPMQPFATFSDALKRTIDAVENPALEDEWRAFLDRHAWTERQVPYVMYRRVRLLFEATRDGGFWQIRWTITNREPTSAEIWNQWARAPVSVPATAECDEISALTAFLARRLGVGPIGLYWPTRNHTIVAWTPVKGGVRVLLPTTQIFLTCPEGFDHATYAAAAVVQKTVYDYTARDLDDLAPIPAALVDSLLGQVTRYGHASPDTWDLLRYHRHARHASSTAGCPEVRHELVSRLLARHTAADEAAISAYITTELGRPSAHAFAANLALLATPEATRDVR